MRKQIKALGMALFAAMVVLAAIDPRSRQPKRVAAGFEEFNGCPFVTKCVCGEVRGISKGVTETIKSIQGAFTEIKITLQSEPRKTITLGKSCYVGESGKYSVFTKELTVSLATKNTEISSEVSDDNNDVTNTFYEQTQLKDCLA